MADRARFFEGKKFMWDGHEYSTKKAADEAKGKYVEDGFDVESCREGKKVLLYTRRVVTEVEVQ
jgi:hypothetical protein